MKRLTHLPTLKIDTSKKISVYYRSKTHTGWYGDTIATLLYADGIRVFGRSLKYHRPRGLYSLDGECSNTMMAVDGRPNVRAETTMAADGMHIAAQNVQGTSEKPVESTPEKDWMGFMDHLSWAMPAGFYYRIFHKPEKLWPIAVSRIRKAAGVGVLTSGYTVKGRYDEIYPATDVCVVGGGPAGMEAALSAADKGLRVILMESRPWLGGFYDYRTSLDADGVPLYRKANAMAERIAGYPNIRVFKNAPVVGVYGNSMVTAFQRGGRDRPFEQRYIEIQTRSIVVAAGCIERPLLFENNERPGVMQMGCAHRLARTWGILPGRRAVFSIGHDLGLEAAIDLADLGMKVVHVADVREDGQDQRLLDELKKRDIPFSRGWTAIKAGGKRNIEKVTIGTVNGMRRREFSCDTLAASAGLTPVTGPLATAGAKLEYHHLTGFFLPVKLPDNVYAAGRLLGLNDPASVEASGRLNGLRAAAACGVRVDSELKAAEAETSVLPGPVRNSKMVTAPVKNQKMFICFDEDTTVKNVDQAMDRGFDVPELIKRFTAAGTGPGQGGVPGHNLPLYVAQRGDSPDVDPRPITVRPPLTPVLLATYAGRNHDMHKRTPVHESQSASDGRMDRAGVWLRARYFSDDRRSRREIENVRGNVGVLDASTLGKFRIFGNDALKALQRVYIGDMNRVREHRMTYAAMCNDDGCLIDDGVIVKQAENDYYFTTSTGRSGATIEWIRYHTRYENLDFHMVNLTDAFGVINLAGPNSRNVLQKIADVDISNEAFPFMGYREFTINDIIPVRAMRLGFVGELSYELHVPSSYMQAVWDLLEKAGKSFKIKKFGLEAQNTLRLEKCHVIIGSESEQRTTLCDLGLGFLWCKSKPEANTVGSVALRQTENQSGRLKLVGFKMKNGLERPPKDGSPIVDSRIRGYVCTARFSFTLNEPIGMALVEDSYAKPGSVFGIYENGCKGRLIRAEVVKTPFYDPTGERMKS